MDVRTFPIERLFRGDATPVVRAYNMLLRANFTTISHLISRGPEEVARTRGIGKDTFAAIIGCMMDFDTAHGTKLEAQFTRWEPEKRTDADFISTTA